MVRSKLTLQVRGRQTVQLLRLYNYSEINFFNFKSEKEMLLSSLPIVLKLMHSLAQAGICQPLH